ncbi:MAG TPA: L,D-transpeptidase family protein, partial [Geminicoccaceae bacterium]|nr:L,D-transpeptidase family protein [Geminicoccaceae bacterium]
MRSVLVGAARRMLALLLVTPLVAGLAAPAAAARSGDLIGKITYHVTDGRRTLLEVAREHGLGIVEVSAANPGIDAWVPGPERLVTLPTAHLLPDAPREGLVVNLAELRLYFFPPGGGPVQTHPSGVGREGFSTPIGETKVVRKQERPTWHPTESTLRDRPELPKVVPPGPDNPLGAHAIYLGWPTYLIHGTNKPLGVGRRVSRGCIRMYPEDVARLYPQVKVAIRVTTVQQTIKLGWHEGELYLEAHPEIDQIDELEHTYTMTPRPGPDIRAQVRDRAGTDAWRVDWRIVEAELMARRGVPARITAAEGVALAAPELPRPPLSRAPSPMLVDLGEGLPDALEPARGGRTGTAVPRGAAASRDWRGEAHGLAAPPAPRAPSVPPAPPVPGPAVAAVGAVPV